MVAPSANAIYNSIVGFMEADIGREIWIADEERRTGRPVTPFGGAGNLLLAVGLLCYTECFGAYLSGFRVGASAPARRRSVPRSRARRTHPHRLTSAASPG